MYKRQPYVYVTVRVPRESGEWSFVPLRLSKGAIPSDALAHRRVDLFQNSYSGVGMLIPSQKPPEEWELSPLSEDFKLKPGMVLAPMPQPIGQVLNFFNITLASGILKNSTRPRTILMAEPVSYTHLDVYKRQP